jgi:hypothetical protein
VHHIRFLIFDWSVPNVIMGVIVIAVFFLWAATFSGFTGCLSAAKGEARK